MALRFPPRRGEAGLLWKAVCSDVRMAGSRVKRKGRQGSSGSEVWRDRMRPEPQNARGTALRQQVPGDLASENSSNLPFSQRRLVWREIRSRPPPAPPSNSPHRSFTGWKEICVEIKLEKSLHEVNLIQFGLIWNVNINSSLCQRKYHSKYSGLDLF